MVDDGKIQLLIVSLLHEERITTPLSGEVPEPQCLYFSCSTDNFDVISGDDALTFSMIASGAAGVISVIGNALPKAFSRMIRLEFRGEYEPARKIHHSFTELYSLLFVDGNPAGVKALLNDMGFIENELRLPLVPTRIATKQKMSDILKTLNI